MKWTTIGAKLREGGRSETAPAVSLVGGECPNNWRLKLKPPFSGERLTQVGGETL